MVTFYALFRRTGVSVDSIANSADKTGILKKEI